jgi:Cu+-exporting ATPase
MSASASVSNKVHCYHCGDECREVVHFDDKPFCCEGCRLVYDILRENNLCSYYSLNERPGTSQRKPEYGERFAYLDQEAVRSQLIRFTDGRVTRVTFFIPNIHCSSCIWLLEHLQRIHDGVIRSQVNFARREAEILFNERQLSLRKLVEMLSTIGYEPQLRLDDLGKKERKRKSRGASYRIGIAGFAFGNIMLFSFPEYFSPDLAGQEGFAGVFRYLNLGLSLPVLLYCSQPFFLSAWHSLRQRYLNIDVPIALGIGVMFLRSAWEILSGAGSGYMDTMSGLVFFMLVGRAFQARTYSTISFEREYQSFFPVSVMVRKGGRETSVPVSDLRPGDTMIIRNEELIPADALLVDGEAHIDFSFVTGESVPVARRRGERIYAGGRQLGQAIELKVLKAVEQSYLTRLWNTDMSGEKEAESRFQQLVDRISHSFTMVLLSVALAALVGWALAGDLARGWNAFTAVLIIACPCALAISSPFTLGNMLRIFGRHRLYLKQYNTIEKLAGADTVVFDKTGTLTRPEAANVEFHGAPLQDDEWKMIRSVLHHSSHPLSRMLAQALPGDRAEAKYFSEETGRGIRATVFDIPVKLGAPAFVGYRGEVPQGAAVVYVSIQDAVRGYFSVGNRYREGVAEMIRGLKEAGYSLSVVSGDHDGEAENLKAMFGADAQLLFHQSPADKLQHVLALQRSGRKVLMVGDGLNDAGALRHSHVSVTVSEDLNNFSPACDGILDARRITRLPAFLKAARRSRRIILASFAIALVYNVFGLSFAIAGRLSPVVAAILMPLSTVTIISFTTLLSGWLAGRGGFSDKSHVLT